MPYPYERKNRNTRLNDFEWDIFKRYLGAEWLRAQIHLAAKANNEQAPAKKTNA